MLNYFPKYCFIEAVIDRISVAVVFLEVLETKFLVGITCPFGGVESRQSVLGSIQSFSNHGDQVDCTRANVEAPLINDGLVPVVSK